VSLGVNFHFRCWKIEGLALLTRYKASPLVPVFYGNFHHVAGG